MGKVEDEIKNLKNKVEEMEKKIGHVDFMVIQIFNELKKLTSGEMKVGEQATEVAGSSIDIDAIEKLLDEKLKNIARSPAQVAESPELSEIKGFVESQIKVIKDAVTTLVNVLQGSGSLTSIEEQLFEIKALLEEVIYTEDKNVE